MCSRERGNVGACSRGVCTEVERWSDEHRRESDVKGLESPLEELKFALVDFFLSCILQLVQKYKTFLLPCMWPLASNNPFQVPR